MACQGTINTVAFMFESLSLSFINYLVDMASAKHRLQDTIRASFQLKQLLPDLVARICIKCCFPSQMMIFLGRRSLDYDIDAGVRL